jgi:ATP synthase protein I
MSRPRPDEKGRDNLSRLDADLASFESRRRKASAGESGGAVVGYQMLGQMLGGVLGGLGLGWLIDRYAHTSPWGLVAGLLVGAVLSISSTIRLASRMGSVRPGSARLDSGQTSSGQRKSGASAEPGAGRPDDCDDDA